MNPRNTIVWKQDDDGVVILTLDDSGQAVNTMNDAYVSSMEAALARLDADRDRISGVVLMSAKKTFFAGGDLTDLRKATKGQVVAVTRHVREIKSQLRRLERLGMPVVA